MEKYYFELQEGTLNCTEECGFTINKIGSQGCNQCEHCSGFDNEENWIKCEIYSAFAEVATLEIENEKLKCKVERLENELSSLKGGL